MKRREFVEKIGIGSAGIVAAATIGHGGPDIRRRAARP